MLYTGLCSISSMKLGNSPRWARCLNRGVPGRGLVILEDPGQGVRNVHAPASGQDGRHDIGFERVADHHAAGGAIAEPGEDPLIGGGGLVADDLDRGEEVAKAGLGKLALLIEEIALGDEDEAVASRQALEGVPRMGECLDGMGEHLMAGGEDFTDDPRRYPPLRQLDCGFDHRQGEALDAESVYPEVALLGLKQPARYVLRLAMVGD
jgi:hypothetical protein